MNINENLGDYAYIPHASDYHYTIISPGSLVQKLFTLLKPNDKKNVDIDIYYKGDVIWLQKGIEVKET